MITRLYAMYQGSRKTLIFLVVIFVAFTITCGVITAIGDIHMFGGKLEFRRNSAIRLIRQTSEELILSGTYQCTYEWEDISLDSMAWILYIVEFLALCLAVWIAVKHFRELRRSLTEGTIGGCSTVLMKTHVLYFVNFATVSSFQLSHYSPNLKTKELETGTLIYTAHLEIFSLMQMFVLGPRLILGIREHHTKLVGSSDAETGYAETLTTPRARNEPTNGRRLQLATTTSPLPTTWAGKAILRGTFRAYFCIVELNGPAARALQDRGRPGCTRRRVIPETLAIDGEVLSL
ncbi:hypothetical protein BDR04DRAFT_1149117 [Suillus decipiens]|nr:hypothetical protein BDR04DRAFT_1149117 [Suillus decipiens]